MSAAQTLKELKELQMKNINIFKSLKLLNEENIALNKANTVMKESYDILNHENEEMKHDFQNLKKKIRVQVLRENEVVSKKFEKKMKNITIINHKIKNENKSLKERIEILNEKILEFQLHKELMLNEKSESEHKMVENEVEIKKYKDSIAYLNTNLHILTKENAEYILKSETKIQRIQEFHSRKYEKLFNSFQSLQNRIHSNKNCFKLTKLKKKHKMKKSRNKSNKNKSIVGMNNNINFDYLKNIIIKFLLLSQELSEEQITLLPVLASILRFGKKEKKMIDNAYFFARNQSIFSVGMNDHTNNKSKTLFPLSAC